MIQTASVGIYAKQSVYQKDLRVRNGKFDFILNFPLLTHDGFWPNSQNCLNRGSMPPRRVASHHAKQLNGRISNVRITVRASAATMRIQIRHSWINSKLPNTRYRVQRVASATEHHVSKTGPRAISQKTWDAAIARPCGLGAYFMCRWLFRKDSLGPLLQTAARATRAKWRLVFLAQAGNSGRPFFPE